MPEKPETVKMRKRLSKTKKKSRTAQEATFANDIRKLKITQEKLNWR